jgi:hypothetical protein
MDRNRQYRNATWHDDLSAANQDTKKAQLQAVGLSQVSANEADHLQLYVFNLDNCQMIGNLT